MRTKDILSLSEWSHEHPKEALLVAKTAMISGCFIMIMALVYYDHINTYYQNT